jgi:glycosyltransferase involved in cell wall biosynthesis
LEFSNFSLLVTCYNKEPYVQGFCEIADFFLLNGGAIVLVDDGSTDDSYLALEHLCDTHAKIKLIRTENFGSASARNLTLKHLETEFFMFWDIDDLVDLNSISVVLDGFKNSDSRIAVTNYVSIPGDQFGSMPLRVTEKTTVEIGDLRSQILDSMGYWRYIYRKSVIIDHYGMRFVPTRQELNNSNFILDDLFWMMEIASLSGTILIYPHNQITYKYRTNQVQADAAWERYINQVLDIPAALLAFEKYMNVKEFNLFGVRKKLYLLMLRRHFSYLSKKQRLEFFVNFVKIGKFDSKLRLMTAPLAYCLVIDMLSLLRMRLKRSPT